MLAKLRISNYAIIDQLSISFDRGLNVMTGETGAGKSIILGAIGLIMGNRADTKSLYRPESKCIIEGEFANPSQALLALLEKFDLDVFPDMLYIRREISPGGRSRAFCNDTPVKLQQLSEIAAYLVDIHQQFATLELREKQYQVHIIDVLSQALQDRTVYHEKYQAFREQELLLKELIEKERQSRKDIDYLNFQLNELHALELNAEEDDALSDKLYAFENAESIKQQLMALWHHLKNKEYAILDQVQEQQNELERSGEHHAVSRAIAERLASIIAELDDIAAYSLEESEQVEYDPDEIEKLRTRMDRINALLLKHNARDVPALIDVQESFEKRLHEISSLQDDIDAMKEELKEQRAQAVKLAEILSEKRRKGIPGMKKRIEALLGDLGMEKARIEVVMDRRDHLAADGMDDIEILFTANLGKAPGRIKDVASGGELSRLALVIKALLAAHTDLPTMIFDEIDAGVSGNVALKMGHILHEMADQHQMIVITHSAQIAAQGNSHYHVYKEEMNGRTTTGITQLEDAERVEKIAIMLSSDPPSGAAIANAKELLSLG